MNNISISPEDNMIIKSLRFNHPHPRVQLRMEVLWLKSCKILSHKQICEITDISPNTLRSYIRMYKEGGIDNLCKVNFNRPQSTLVEHKISLEKYFRENPVASISEAINIIEKQTGIQRKPTQVRKFLKSIWYETT